MDVQRPIRERVFSILNDNNCPSFTFKQRQDSSPARQPQKLPSFSCITAGLSPRLERPSLSRHQPFNRKSSVSSVGSPPLLRYDSASSSKSSSSMDSTPSPITPAYNYNDSNIVQYDPVLRPDLNTNAYLPSPTGITPFMDQGIMIAPGPDPFSGMAKAIPPMNPNPAVYQLPTPVIPREVPQMPTPALSTNVSVSSVSTAPPPASADNSNNANPTGKKNKYPCPYASSHNCTATFTTSGHAARHGKKHTGEKGVHCPVCDKAFTRKDNMKQHERTHKNREHNKGEDKKSKAQITREANKAKEVEKQTEQESSQLAIQDLPELQHPARIRKSSSGHSEPSDITLAPPLVNTPTMNEGMFDPNPQIAIAPDVALDMSMSTYPPLSDEVMLAGGLMHDNKASDLLVPQPPALIRGFSDLDTLAQAAESAFDPYFQQNSF